MRRHCWLLAPLLLFLLSGCMTNRYAPQKRNALTAPTPLACDLGGDPVQVRLESVIFYHGLGSWKREALWDELIVTVTNRSDQPLTLTGASLADRTGHIAFAGQNPWDVEKASESQRRRYTKAGVSFALNTLGYAAITTGTVGVGLMTGAAVTGTWAGVGAGAVVGLAAVPVIAVVVYAKNDSDRRAIEAEFHRRLLPLPVTLAPGESRTASLFFPMSLSPRSLELRWARGADAGATTYATPQLQGLHEAEPPK